MDIYTAIFTTKRYVHLITLIKPLINQYHNKFTIYVIDYKHRLWYHIVIKLGYSFNRKNQQLGAVKVSTGILKEEQLSVDCDHVKTWKKINAEDNLAYAA